MKILFICFSTLKFDVTTPGKKPLGGTESAIAYLATELANEGHCVTLMCNLPDGIHGKLINGVRHVIISEDVAEFEPHVVIVASAPMAAPGVKKLLPNAKIVLWNHMRPDQPAMQQLFQPDFRNSIDQIIYVSDSQKKAFLDLSKTIDGNVINNAIAPCFENLFSSSQEVLAAKKVRGAYTSTPYRGLGVLAEIKEIPIDVYSSMDVYQGDNDPYKPMFDVLRRNDCITLHGSCGQEELAIALHPVSFMVYPSIFAECHSIAIIEAMAAGLKVVTTDVAHAQTEFVDSMPSKEATVEGYAKLLRKNVNYFRAYPAEWSEKIWKQVQYVNQEFTWRKRAREWTDHLQKLIAAPPQA